MTHEEIKYFKELIDKNPSTYMCFTDEAKNEKEITNYALDKNPFNMWYLSPQLKDDREYARTKLSTYPTFHLNKLSPRLQTDKDMVMFAMRHNSTFDLRDLEHTCTYFINDKDVMARAEQSLQANPYLVPGEMKMARAMIANFAGKDKAIEEVSKDPEVYRLLKKEFKEDKDIAIAAIDKDPSLINEIPKSLQNVNFYVAAVLAVPDVEKELDFRTRDKVKESLNKLNSLPFNERINAIKEININIPKRDKQTEKDKTGKDER